MLRNAGVSVRLNLLVAVVTLGVISLVVVGIAGTAATGLIVGLGVVTLAAVLLASRSIGRSITKPLIDLAAASDRLAGGGFSFEVDTTRTDEGGRALAAMDRMKSTLTELIEGMKWMSGQHHVGEVDVRIDAERFAGGYREVVEGVNAMVGEHIEVQSKAMAVVRAFGEGDFSAGLELFPGKKASINETVERVRSNLTALIADTRVLSRAAVEGRLDGGGGAERHQGDFRSM